ncbi:unnamed protein product [Caenorhabditis brenneri]
MTTLESRKPQFFTDFMLIFYAFFLGIFLIGAAFYLIFAPIVASNFLCAGAIILTCLLVFGVLKLMKLVMDRWHLEREIGRLGRVKNEMMVGLSGVTICGIVPRVAVCFIGADAYALIYTHTVFLLSAFIFQYIFTFGHNRWVKFQVCDQCIPHFFIIFFNLLVFILSIRIGAAYPSENDQLWIILTQVGLGIISTGGSVELFMVYNNELCLNNDMGHLRPSKEVEEIPDNFTDVVMPSYVFLMVILTIVMFCFVVSATVTWIWAAIIVATCLVAHGMISLVRWAVHHVVSEVPVMKVDLIIGYVGVMVCAVAPRMLVYFVGLDVQILSFTLIASLISAISFHSTFLHPHPWTLDVKNNRKTVWTLIFIHFAGLITSIRVAVSYENPREIETIIYFQLLFCLISAASMIDFGLILVGGLRKKLDVGVKVETVKVKKVKKVKKSKNSMIKDVVFECKICAHEYNSLDRIPRILRECGHTVCGLCAEQLLENGVLKCPFCQLITIVNGSSSSLPKNYEVLEVV